MSLTKGEKKELMKERGVWDQFVQRREELKDQGVKASQAWDRAAAEYLPEADSATSSASGDTDFLVDRARFKDSDASAREVVEWVFNNVAVEGIQPEDAPSPGAWGLLLRVRNDTTLQKEFYRSVWPKLLPSQAEIDKHANKFEDDGREHFQLIERVKERAGEESSDAVLRPGAQKAREEPGVAQGDAE